MNSATVIEAETEKKAVPSARSLDYGREYKDYWSCPDRWGSHSFKDPEAIADQILLLCGGGPVLDVGFGMALLARTLLKRGLDVRGIDVTERVVEEANRHAPGRFALGSILEIPHAAETFQTIVSTDCLEHIAEADVARALAELHRVARRFVFIRLATTAGPDRRWHLTIRDRSWWEQRFFEAGFRKHPLIQTILPYESLENEASPITLVLEKIPPEALAQFPSAAWQAERDLHMDMLRESGRRSDAHIARYQLAKEYVRPHELVLDAACGLGYGTALLAQGDPSIRVLGIDSSAFAAAYAQSNFSPYLANAHFREGDVCQLEGVADNSVGLVVSFETVEHLRDPDPFLREVQRVLRPGGRFICSVPNLWLDETGQDPNPWHFQVFDFSKLAKLCRQFFSLQTVYRQNAGGGMKCPDAPRLLRQMNLPVTSGQTQAEWWLSVCVKEPARALIEQTNGECVVALAPDPAHPLYQSWLSSCPMPAKIFSHLGVDFELPEETALVVTADTYSEPGVTLIRKAVEKNIPTLILADGILEYRNTWEHPQLVAGSLFQPVLGHKIACIGRSQARFLESWGNTGQCEIVGAPHLDRYCELKRRERQPGAPFRILVMTAKTPYFTDHQHDLVRESLHDLKNFFTGQPTFCEVRLEPVWRVTKGLEKELGVSSAVTDLTGRELAEVLQTVDAVITTPSTAMLEGMLLGLPVAVLDYCNVPLYVQPAWRIAAPQQISDVLTDLVDPPEARMLFQESTLHDTLECASLAAPRMIQLAMQMVEAGRQAKMTGQPLRFASPLLEGAAPEQRENRFHLPSLYPGQSRFHDHHLSALQAEVGHLRQYAAALEQRAPAFETNGLQAAFSEEEQHFSFITNFPLAKLVRGTPGQMAIWDVTLDESCSKSIYLQPPLEVVFEIPVSARGRLCTAVTLHPDVWNKPEAGACEFHIRVNERLAFGLTLDPVNLPQDRRWHEIILEVPESSNGHHHISFETRSVGKSADFRWALWRAPRFVWKKENTDDQTALAVSSTLASDI